MITTQQQNTDLTKKQIIRVRIILVFLTFAGMSFVGNAEDLQTVPFWQTQQGHWLSENTYMDGKYNSKIAHYGTIFSINVDAEEATIVERKYYPPGHFPGSAVGLEIPEKMGVQLIQITKAKTIGSEDAPGSVLFAPLNAYTANSEDRIQPVTDSAALFTSTNKSSNQPTYQMLITLPTPNTRIVVNLGLNQQDKIYELGPLRGVSVFSAVRIELSDVDKEQKLLRERYNTGVVVTTDEDGKFKATWLTKQ